MKSTVLYQGKAKNVYGTEQTGILRLDYLDQATALNGKKKDTIKGKGALNNQITALIFESLTEQGIAHHFIEKVSDTEQLVKEVTIIPLEVVVRNRATGSFTKRLGVKEGTVLGKPIVEFYYKKDALDDPFINEAHIEFLGIATREEVAYLTEQALLINNVLTKLFLKSGLILVDFKLEFGKLSNGNILLSDEISPDTCRLWDVDKGYSLDKDIYRHDTGDIIPVYEEVLLRLNQQVKENCHV